METERLLLRAISLDRSWKSNEPKYLYDWSFNAHHDVLSMVLLPGGQYLVASVADRVQKHYAIVVFAMDHRTAGAVPLAKTPTTTKAFHLQAKYMTIKEERGIVISYVRRDYKHFRDRRKGPFAPGAIDISKYSPDHDVDPQVPVKYECVTLHVSLYSLEVLSDPRFVPGSAEFLQHARAQPRPFRIIAVIRTRSPLGPPTLDEVFGSPYLAIVKRPNSIMFKNLNGGAVSTLTCSPSPVHPNEVCLVSSQSTPANGFSVKLYSHISSWPFDCYHYRTLSWLCVESTCHHPSLNVSWDILSFIMPYLLGPLQPHPSTTPWMRER